MRNYKHFISTIAQRELCLFKENRKTCRFLFLFFFSLKSIVSAFKFQFRFACLESNVLPNRNYK